MKKIHLPCLRGNFGDWVYYSTVIPIRDIVQNSRIITVSESGDLYTKNINEILQREVDTSRISKIKEYLLKNPERFFSSLILAIHQGNPEWAEFNIERQFRIDNKLVDETDVKFIEMKLGVLTLSGSEELFVLDGQHRLLGIRKAFHESKEIGNDEISVIIVIHNQLKRERTRRLFTVLNRYAEKVKEAEKIILEEDDAAAILTRRLVQEDPIFLKDNAIASTKQFNLSSTDFSHFTTLVCVYQVSQTLIDYKTLYKSKVIVRPNDGTLENLGQHIKNFWKIFFELFPETVNFIEGQKQKNLESFNRNRETGGSLLLRPEGQKLFAEVYQEFLDSGRLGFFKENVVKIDFDLNSIYWKYVFWVGGTMVSGNKKLKKAIFRYLLGEIKAKHIVSEGMKEVYKKYNLDYQDEIKPVVS